MAFRPGAWSSHPRGPAGFRAGPGACPVRGITPGAGAPPGQGHGIDRL